MNRIQAYAEAHKARRISKRIQQLSWTLNKIEMRFEIEELEGEDLQKLVEAYNEIFKELMLIINELNNENTDSSH